MVERPVGFYHDLRYRRKGIFHHDMSIFQVPASSLSISSFLLKSVFIVSVKHVGTDSCSRKMPRDGFLLGSIPNPHLSAP